MIAVGMIVTLLTLYYISGQVDFTLFIHALQTAEYQYVISCMILLLIGLFTRALRWHVLLDRDLPLSRAFSIMNVAYLVNGIFPLRIGEVARVYLASRLHEPIPIPRTTSTIIVERLLDLISIVLMVLLALVLGSVPDELRMVSGVAAVLALGGFGVLLFLAWKQDSSIHWFRLIVLHVPFLHRLGVLDTWFQQFLDGVRPLTIPRIFLQVTIWTGLSWMLSIVAGYVLMFAFFEQANIAATMLYIAAAAFAIALPAVPGNIGTYEASILLALMAMGYEKSSTAVAFAVMVHAVNVFVHASTGLVGFIQEGISLDQLSRGVQQIQTQSNRVG